MNRNSKEQTEKIEICIEEIIRVIDTEKQKIENKKLLEICSGVGTILSGKINPHFCHEIAETALNVLIKRKYARDFLISDNPADVMLEILKPIAERLPTQTWRSREQNIWQQFSTPPAIAYLLAYLLDFKIGELVLEPSAGTGSLAAWSSGFGLVTHANEIDPRRRYLLACLGFAPTSFNAEFINDYLPPEIFADSVMMNPPFSANGERTKNNSSKFGFRHVESSLERLRKGGKFGVILGCFAELSTKTGSEFWEKMSGRIRVKAIIKIAGREYYKNGTSACTTLIVGEKLLEEQKVDWNAIKSQIVSVSVQTVEDAFNIAQNLNLRLHQ